MLSTDIRRKSVRREALWRQQTLRAAYTTSDAKQSINVVAAVIVDEIVDHIRHFADPKHLDSLLVGVRKIVKLAAETWRLARVERELIIAVMPSAEDEQTSNEEWEEHADEGNASPDLRETAGDAAPKRRVLLRVSPRIVREAVHEDFLSEDGEKRMPCIYSSGVVLYDDSPSVIARRAELAKKTASSSGAVEESGATPPIPLTASPREHDDLVDKSDADVENIENI
jgi:hypothetical protein